VAQRRPTISGQETAREVVLEHRGAEAKEMRATRRKKVERRRGVHGAKLSSELGRAPASDSHGQEPYHGKPR
jgi:hypothetical protein